MAPKRKEAPASPVKVAKKAKVDLHFQQALKKILEWLNESDGLTASGRKMLCASAEFALRPAKSDRHKFQTSLANNIADILKKVELSKKDVLEEMQKKIAQQDVEKESITDALMAVGPQVDARKQTKEDSDAALKEAVDAHVAAKKVHEEAVEAKGRLDAEHQITIAAKAEREKLISESWAQLRDATIEARNWRHKNKLIEGIVQVLTGMGVEVSCTEALPLALKERKDQRGPIGTKCLEYVEAHLQRSVKELADQIDGHGANTSQKLKEEEEAAAKVKELADVKEKKENEVIEAENCLMESTEERAKLNRQTKEFDSQAKKRTVAAAKAQEEYDQIHSKNGLLENILEQGEAATAPAAVVETPTKDDEAAVTPSKAAAVEHVEEKAADAPMETLE